MQNAVVGNGSFLLSWRCAWLVELTRFKIEEERRPRRKTKGAFAKASLVAATIVVKEVCHCGSCDAVVERSTKVQDSKTAKVQDPSVPMKTPIFADDHCFALVVSESGSRFQVQVQVWSAVCHSWDSNEGPFDPNFPVKPDNELAWFLDGE